MKRMNVTAVKAALQRVAAAQREFWEALSDFEHETGVSVMSTFDFIDYTDPTDDDVRDVCKYAEEK